MKSTTNTFFVHSILGATFTALEGDAQQKKNNTESVFSTRSNELRIFIRSNAHMLNCIVRRGKKMRLKQLLTIYKNNPIVGERKCST